MDEQTQTSSQTEESQPEQESTATEETPTTQEQESTTTEETPPAPSTDVVEETPTSSEPIAELIEETEVESQQPTFQTIPVKFFGEEVELRIVHQATVGELLVSFLLFLAISTFLLRWLFKAVWGR